MLNEMVKENNSDVKFAEDLTHEELVALVRRSNALINILHHELTEAEKDLEPSSFVKRLLSYL